MYIILPPVTTTAPVVVDVEPVPLVTLKFPPLEVVPPTNKFPPIPSP